MQGCVNPRARLEIFSYAWLHPIGIKQALGIEDRALLKGPKDNYGAQWTQVVLSCQYSVLTSLSNVQSDYKFQEHGDSFHCSIGDLVFWHTCVDRYPARRNNFRASQRWHTCRGILVTTAWSGVCSRGLCKALRESVKRGYQCRERCQTDRTSLEDGVNFGRIHATETVRQYLKTWSSYTEGTCSWSLNKRPININFRVGRTREGELPETSMRTLAE